jgi:hypothetical protein
MVAVSVSAKAAPEVHRVARLASCQWPNNEGGCLVRFRTVRGTG